MFPHRQPPTEVARIAAARWRRDASRCPRTGAASRRHRPPPGPPSPRCLTPELALAGRAHARQMAKGLLQHAGRVHRERVAWQSLERDQHGVRLGPPRSAPAGREPRPTRPGRQIGADESVSGHLLDGRRLALFHEPAEVLVVAARSRTPTFTVSFFPDFILPPFCDRRNNFIVPGRPTNARRGQSGLAMPFIPGKLVRCSPSRSPA